MTLILVVTSSTDLGDRIQKILDETGHYQAALADSVEMARQLACTIPFALCVLDADLEKDAQAELGSALADALPGLRMIHVSPACDPTDLLDSLAEALAPAQSLESPPLPVDLPPTSLLPASFPSSPDWLQDVTRAAQHLASLSLESAAQAALILREGDLWAYAGQLPQHAAQALSETVSHHWAKGGGRDLARFVSLGEAGGDFMLYATRLTSDMVLALAFDAETPFSKMRSQAGQLARALASPPSTGTGQPAALQPPQDELTPPEVEIPPLSLMLDDIPPPTVSGRISAPQERPVPATPPFFEDELVEPPQPVLPSVRPIRVEPLPAIRLPIVAEAETLEETRPAEVERIKAPAPAVDDFEETRPHVVGELVGKTEFQPISPAVCSLYYACMLIPRLPQHHLTGDLAAQLSDWMEQLCLAFAWRLEHLAIRPDYLQWIVSVTPATSPSYLMRIMRQHTSQRIFAEHPAMAQENPSGDFWAPGYLIMSTSQPPPAQVTKDFIQRTRRQQGASKAKSQRG